METQIQEELTLEKLSSFQIRGIISKGTGTFEHFGEGEVTWIAIKVHSGRWTIYYDASVYPESSIIKYGHILLNKKLVKELVPCSTEALQSYRI